MTAITVDGAIVDIAEQGSGKPLVLLHSLLADRSVFDKIVPRLAKSRHVIVPDLPGFGGSSSAGPTIAGIADRLASLLSAMRLGPETDVLGNGLGGFVASTLAIRHGAKIGRLVLAGTGAGFSDQGRGAFHVMAEKVRGQGMEGVVEIAMKRLFPEPFLAARPEIVEERRRGLLRTNPAFFAEACEALAGLDLRASVGGIVNATLVVVGALDAATPPVMGRELAQAIPGARFLELPGIGHAPMAQDPEAFLTAISGFLGLEA